LKQATLPGPHAPEFDAKRRPLVNGLDSVAKRAVPFYFDDLAGWFHAATGSTAVLFHPPWGYEELAARKFYRVLAEHLAKMGFPVLRFDYWGTGQSGDGAGPAAEHGFLASARRAYQELETLVQPQSVVLLGQGLGGLIAGALAREVKPEGLALLAPALSGRRYTRELQAFAAMTQPTFLAGASDGPDGGLFAGGFSLTKDELSELKGLTLTKGAGVDQGEALARESLIVARPQHAGDETLGTRLESLGSLTHQSFDGYEDYAANPTLSVFPFETFENVTSWFAGTFDLTAQPHALPAVSQNLARDGEDFRERACRFGSKAQFYGVLCIPADGEPTDFVVFLNAGYDHSIGWGRAQVDQARDLARNGIGSLRFDLAGIGESAYWPGQPGQVLYSLKQLEDVRCCLDFLKAEYPEARILLYGRCSGGYLALAAAEADDRVSGAFVVNSRRLVWDPFEDVDAAIREPIQTLDTYARKAFSLAAIKRLLTGDLTLSRAVSRLSQAIAQRLSPLIAPVFRQRSAHYRQQKQAQIRYAALRDRELPVWLVYSEGDRGRGEVEKWLGSPETLRRRYPNIQIKDMKGGDHNLTPLEAREDVYRQLKAALKR